MYLAMKMKWEDIWQWKLNWNIHVFGNENEMGTLLADEKFEGLLKHCLLLKYQKSNNITMSAKFKIYI